MFLANSSQDKKRIAKTLFTSHDHGPLPVLWSVKNEQEEAMFMAREIKRLIAYSGGVLGWNDFAVLREYSPLFPVEQSAQIFFGVSP